MPAALLDTAVQWGGPASYQLRDRDQLTGDELMDQDYSHLPSPWLRLSDAAPEDGQSCEWVLLMPDGADTGIGEWTVINSQGPVTGLIELPGDAYVRLSGFRDDKGLHIFDPKKTLWRLIP